MNTSPRTYWALVADSGRARFFELQKTPPEFRELRSMTSEALHQRSSDLVSDGVGRDYNARGPLSHSKKPRSDPHDLAEQAFSRQLVDELEQAANEKAFEKLLVVADPKTLGRLRPLMSKQLRERISDEVNLDLVALPQQELEQRVRAQLGW